MPPLSSLPTVLILPRAWFRAFRRRLEGLQQFAPLAVFALLYLGLSLLLRVVLWSRFDPAAETSLWHLALILAGGVVNDAVESLYLLLPFSLVLLVVPGHWQHRLPFRILLGVGAFLTLFGLLYATAADYYFFEEFNARFNLVAVGYLLYPTEVLTNIWESYPVVPVLIGTGVLSVLGLWLIRPWLRRREPYAMPLRRRGAIVLAHVLLLALAVGTYSTDTLARFDNRIDNEVARNGLSSLFQALRTMDLDYSHYYRTAERRRMFGLLTDSLRGDGRFTDLTDGLLTRHHAGNPDGLGKLNVVVIVEESLSAEFLGAYGAPYHGTPHFDALAKQGLLFTHTFASGTRTVRGLEAISASFPPIPTASIIHRPGSEHIANWGQVMREHGYRSSFLYGGYGYFDNMNHYFSSNGFAVHDRTDIQHQTYANIWGVCDEDLFRYAVGFYDREHASGQPFFSMIMSTSNHKPFTFPEGIPGVKPSGGGRAAGVRYADYALGRFFDMARKRPWFDDTVFVVVADHGARVYGAGQIPVHSYRIPLLVLSPGHIAPRHVDDLMGQIDIAPTVLGLLGLPYDAPFFGQDVLALHGRPHPILFNHNYDVALLENDRMVVLGLNRTVRSYAFDPDHPEFVDTPPDPHLVDLATAYYQTAYRLFREHRYVERLTATPHTGHAAAAAAKAAHAASG